jgi:N-acetylglucosamine-6-phosphate deacetylase
MMQPLIIKGLNVYTENKILKQATVVVREGLIQKVGAATIKDNAAKVLEFPADWHLIPGMIDLHIHGAGGADTMDATFAALDTISKSLLREGVTAFLPATMTAPISQIEEALINVRDYLREKKNTSGAEVLGINLEGPFLSTQKPAAQLVSAIIAPDIELFANWQRRCDNLIKITTIAPEASNSLEFINYLRDSGVIASIGHSDATYEQAVTAINAGCTQATHLFNAMPPIHHREPGLVTALLLDDRVMTEVIADLVHLHPAILRLIVKLKGYEKIVLVTDSMRAKYLSDGIYDLGGQKVIVKNGEARLVDGKLAGSVLRMNNALKNMINATSCRLIDAIKMTAENPAKQLKIFEHKGSITVGKDADLVVLDTDLQVRMTIHKGIAEQML